MEYGIVSYMLDGMEWNGEFISKGQGCLWLNTSAFNEVIRNHFIWSEYKWG